MFMQCAVYCHISAGPRHGTTSSIAVPSQPAPDVSQVFSLSYEQVSELKDRLSPRLPLAANGSAAIPAPRLPRASSGLRSPTLDGPLDAIVAAASAVAPANGVGRSSYAAGAATYGAWRLMAGERQRAQCSAATVALGARTSPVNACYRSPAKLDQNLSLILRLLRAVLTFALTLSRTPTLYLALTFT